ncbi:MAG: RNA 2',3'-cyclic phosphodiesterase [Chitinophagales bacterium]
MKRLFFAIPIPKDNKQLLAAPFAKKDFFGIRWITKENLHVNLHFLGDTTDETQDHIKKIMPSVCNPIPSFDLELECYKAVSTNGKPVMLWAQLGDNTFFESLSYSLRELFPTDEARKPRPHITLARIRQLHQLPFNLPISKSFSFPVNCVELWESTLHESGATYKSIAQWKLKD